MSFDIAKILAQYDFQFPKSAVALEPASPRDSAKLLVYNRRTDEVCFDTFRHLAKYLPPRSLVVFNDTKVIPARLMLKKPTGGRVEVFYIGQEGGAIKVMADRRLDVGARLTLQKNIFFTVARQEEKFYFLTPSVPMQNVVAVFEKYGETPLPPYLRKTPLRGKTLQEKYQTIFARLKGSVAAPTASLHFTPRLLADLKKAGHDIVFITLHVNLGTFAPLTPAHLQSGQLHEEYFEISAKTAAAISVAKQEGRPVIAVGTTVARALETSASGQLSGMTSIFIREGYAWKVVDGLVTNFHVPQSSLLMLVASLVGRTKILALYQRALKKGFTFFSFGDGMVVV